MRSPGPSKLRPSALTPSPASPQIASGDAELPGAAAHLRMLAERGVRDRVERLVERPQLTADVEEPLLRLEPVRVAGLVSFGEDLKGELYAVAHGGTIYRLR